MNSTEPLTMSVGEAARLLGVSRGLAYEAARRGELPTIRLGRRLLVPRQRLLELIGATNGSEGGDVFELSDVARRPSTRGGGEV